MKKRFLMFLLVGGLMITSAISLSSCKKNNEANEDLNSMPVVESSVQLSRDGVNYGFYCPYCGTTIIVPNAPGPEDYHWHLFGDRPGHEHEFDVMDCERAYNLPEGYHICPYAVEGRAHAHTFIYVLEGGTGPNGYITNSWHVGGGTPYWP